ncbi:MAG: FAD-binding domain-containing protein [Planctomycetota bacterium]
MPAAPPDPPAQSDPQPLPRDFASRDALVAFCRDRFPAADAAHPAVSDTPGGRPRALARLGAIDLAQYARTRNALDGGVTRLSPYLHHGVLTLAEVRDVAVDQGQGGARPGKFVQELAWRDFFRRVLAELGTAVEDDLESWKTGLQDDDYAYELPNDLLAGETGVDFVDASVRELYDTGYLHNQMRMKLAAYVIHARRVHWKPAADWFLAHLLDGDLGSNHLSWQWVASTYSHKPYIFNNENLAKVSGGRFTGGAGPLDPGPFAGSYDDVNQRLFG